MPEKEVATSGGLSKTPAAGRAGTFVGRRHELEQMRTALDAALSGSGGLLLLSGEPGVGKTRLAEEIAREAQVRGAQIAWGRCWEGGGAPAYWPWVQIVREVAGRMSPGWLAEMGAVARNVAQMIPEVRAALLLPEGGLEAHAMPSVPAAPDRPEQTRFKLFDSISVLLRSAATANPLVLVVDDLHAADADSLLLLRFLARDLPQSRILAIATYRELEVRRSAQQAELLGEIIREATGIPLRGLSREEISEFIERYAGFAADSALLESLTKTTEGSPFFLDEIVRLMKAEGRLLSSGMREPRLTIPDSIRAAVRRKLAPLSENARRALSVASVIGLEFDFALLQETSELAREQLIKSLDESIALGLVVEASGAARYRFSHAMIPEVLRAELSRPQLLRSHQRAATAIEQLHRGDLDAHAAAIALHGEQALLLEDQKGRHIPTARQRKKVADYARRGAERSLKQLAYGEAARLYRLALDSVPPARANRAERAELLLGRGEALKKAGNLAEAKQAFTRATELARELDDAVLLARAALAAGTWSTTLFGVNVNTEMVALLEEALAAIGDAASGVRAMLLARLAQELAATEPRNRALELCEEAIETARRVNDNAAMVSALWTQHQLLWGPDGVEKRLEAASEIVRLAEKAGAIDWALSAREFKLSALLELGRIELADREIESYASLQERAGQLSGTVERYRAMRCLMRGEFPNAQRYALEMLRIANRRHDQPLTVAFGTLMIHVRTELGRESENEQIIREYASQFPNLTVPRCGLAAVSANLGREAEARREFERFAADNFAGIPRDWNWICALTFLSEACIYLSDRDHGATLYELLRPYSGRNITIGWGDVSYGALDRYLGRLAALTGRLDDAEAHLEAALRFEQQMGATLAAAHTRYDYATMMLERGRVGDREKALSHLRQALETAAAVGMKDLERRVRRMIATAGADSVGAAPISFEKAGAEVPTRRAIASVLFTDVVGSTERLTELKDRRWSELLEQLRQSLRKEIADFGGREINTAGDGMLVIFNDPGQAIRCAFAIAASAEELELQVRSGIHTGECEFVGADVAGIAVHIAARVVARAGAREVMVSSTVRDLLAGGEMTFVDRGLSVLKGVSGQWRLYAVEQPN